MIFNIDEISHSVCYMVDVINNSKVVKNVIKNIFFIKANIYLFTLKDPACYGVQSTQTDYREDKPMIWEARLSAP